MFLVLKLFLVTVHSKIEDTEISIKAGDSNNSFFDHLQKNPSHEIDWGKVSYFDKKRNMDRRMINLEIYSVWMEIYI